MKTIGLAEVEYVAHSLAKEWMEWNEPIPDFKTRFPRILESCLVTPFNQFGGRDAYHGLVEKAAILFYLMVKNHPFQNGNKRIAVATLFYFLYKNKKWMRLDNQELYNFVVWVAESNAKVKDATAQAIQKFIKTYIEDLK
ncbi:MAG: type II toxin-antitoxin system death-on-curing family toxin [bacterium]|nr:type II toxin-antitoxin system death-on-curing family toxin [bacterium]